VGVLVVPGDLGHRRRVEVVGGEPPDGREGAAARDQAVPEGVDGAPERRDDPAAGDDSGTCRSSQDHRNLAQEAWWCTTLVASPAVSCRSPDRASAGAGRTGTAAADPPPPTPPVHPPHALPPTHNT